MAPSVCWAAVVHEAAHGKTFASRTSRPPRHASLAALEVFMAKWRLFRVPELLAGSFLFGLLGVSASFFLA